jgi:hypothetical protein
MNDAETTYRMAVAEWQAAQENATVLKWQAKEREAHALLSACSRDADGKPKTAEGREAEATLASAPSFCAADRAQTKANALHLVASYLLARASAPQ